MEKYKKQIVEKNRSALKRLSEMMGNKPVRDIFEQNPTDAIFTLRNILGFKCAKCGGSITGGNVRFSNYDEITVCYSCQNNNQ